MVEADRLAPLLATLRLGVAAVEVGVNSARHSAVGLGLTAPPDQSEIFLPRKTNPVHQLQRNPRQNSIKRELKWH
jgi:hypothetical protein